ncbi:hypothetical protein CLOM_g10420 [Closterium sp. NIES-68]|nr:hypothetical protein CLOM_g10420 [Closterium sp. NIES-68]GJP62330.1 hypothetical protein CLOP_g19410 [Closterium sp. NIES-67]
MASRSLLLGASPISVPNVPAQSRHVRSEAAGRDSCDRQVSGLRVIHGSSFLGSAPRLKVSAVPGRKSAAGGRCRAAAENGQQAGAEDPEKEELKKFEKALLEKKSNELADRIASGEFTVASRRVDRLGWLRRSLANLGPPGRPVAMFLATEERRWRAMVNASMPEARGDIRAIIGQPFFVPLFSLYLVYGGVFRLSFGPKRFVIVSDPVVTKHILRDNARSYSKGILSEILDFVMGQGLIPADGEVWVTRRRTVAPALHRKYVSAMVSLFSECSQRLCDKLERAAEKGEVVEMESLFSRMTLDVIGKAVFNYEFNSLSKDTGIVEAVYVTLREAEVRSTALFPYWKIPPLRVVMPSQRKVSDALKLINSTLNELIAECKKMVEAEDVEFFEEYLNKEDPSILHFLVASGDDVTSKQLRDDLMTMLIAGHETSAAVLTWAFYLLAQHPAAMEKLQAEVDSVLGDRQPAIDDFKKLRFTTRVINEAMRLYPQPPVLIRRALEDDVLGGYPIKQGQDIFISVWNLHHSPELWQDAEDFRPERWPLDGPDPNEVTENFSYLPFGGGQRKCIGDVFATFEVTTAVAMLARRFNFSLAPGAEAVGMTTGATIHTTNGLLMTVSRRTPPPAEPTPATGTAAAISEAAAVVPEIAVVAVANGTAANAGVAGVAGGHEVGTAAESTVAA